MAIKNNIKIFLRKFGLDINRYNLIESYDFRLNYFLKLKKIDCLIDVGANVGQYATSLRKNGYKNQIISFEPLSGAFLKLKKKSKLDNKWNVYKMGLGEKADKIKINISKNSYSSSILNVLPLHVSSEVNAVSIGQEEIHIARLDSLKDKNLNYYNNIFIKIDTQGYENRVLDGMSGIVEKIQGLEIELSIYPLYKEQILFRELYDKIEKLGFELWDIRRGFSEKNGRILQVDAIFFKSNNN